jgi:hypothetical protein
MSLIAGAVGDKTVLTDGAQVDHLSENTTGHGVRVKGVSDPTTYPVLAGDVGEIKGAAIDSTNATGYSTSTSTSPGLGAHVDVITLTLDKGVYYIMATSKALSNVNTQISGYLKEGITQISPTINASVTTVAIGTVVISMPLLIKANGTTITMAARVDSGTVSSAVNTIAAIRIA